MPSKMASAVVQRDGSGNFSAGTITASLTGNVTGSVSGSAGSVAWSGVTGKPTFASGNTASAVVQRDASGNFGPEWGEVTELEEENWYFRLSAHVDWLRRHLETTEDSVFPAFRRVELLNALDRAVDTDL